MTFPEEEWGDFGNDIYSIPEMVHLQPSNPTLLDKAEDDIYAIPKMVNFQPSNPTTILDYAEEERRIKALVETSALDYHRETHNSYGRRGGFGRGNGGKMMAGRGFGRGWLESKKPLPGYICRRCKEPGHFIQHCPTNGDHDYDIKRVRPAMGIPRSMLISTPEGSYVLPSGAVVDIKPDEVAFEKAMEGLPSTRAICDLPPELHCPLCKQVMRDAMFTSKCCFSSFCDKCIRDYLMSKSACICGATNILADYLIPNITLRETIIRLESSSSSSDNSSRVVQASSSENSRIVVQVGDTGSDNHAQPKAPSTTLSDNHAQSKAPSTTLSAASKNKDKRSPDKKEIRNRIEENATSKNADPAEGTPELIIAMEPESQPEEVREKLPGKKKKKAHLLGCDIGVQSGLFEDLGAASYTGMPLDFTAYNPFWAAGATQWPFGAMSYVGYEPGHFDVPFAGIHPQVSFGSYGYTMPNISQRSCGGSSKDRRIGKVSGITDVSSSLRSKPALTSQPSTSERANMPTKKATGSPQRAGKGSTAATGTSRPEARDELKRKGSQYSSGRDGGSCKKSRSSSENPDGFKEHEPGRRPSSIRDESRPAKIPAREQEDYYRFKGRQSRSPQRWDKHREGGNRWHSGSAVGQAS